MSEKDLRRVRPDLDERLNPAIRIEFSPAGGRKFGQFTREHLPEEGGAFKYQLGIILDGRLMSAPVINTEIRDSAIIEFGNDARREEVDRIVKILRGSCQECELRNAAAPRGSPSSPAVSRSQVAGRWWKIPSPAVGSLHLLDRVSRRVHNRKWLRLPRLPGSPRNRDWAGKSFPPHHCTRRKA